MIIENYTDDNMTTLIIRYPLKDRLIYPFIIFLTVLSIIVIYLIFEVFLNTRLLDIFDNDFELIIVGIGIIVLILLLIGETVTKNKILKIILDKKRREIKFKDQIITINENSKLVRLVVPGKRGFYSYIYINDDENSYPLIASSSFNHHIPWHLELSETIGKTMAIKVELQEKTANSYKHKYDVFA